MYIDIDDVKLSRIKSINNIQMFDKIENGIHIPCLMIETAKNLRERFLCYKSNLERILIKFKDKETRDKIYDKLLEKME